MKYDHVGRPTNEEVSHRKRLVFIKIMIPIVVIAIIVFIVINNDLLSYFSDNTVKSTKCVFGYHLENNECIKEEVYDAIKLGDCNKDDSVDNNDLVIVKNIAVNKDVSKDIYIAADINQDGNVDLYDYNVLNNYLKKESTNTNIGKYVCGSKDEKSSYKLKNNKCYKRVIFKDINEKQYKVTFDSNGGYFDGSNDKVIEKIVKDKSKIDLPSVTKKGYSFKGWYLSNKRVKDGYKVTKDIKLKAKWRVRSDKLNIVFDGNGGQIIKYKGIVVDKLMIKKTYDTEYGKLPKVKKIGYKFIGWFVNNKEINENTKVTDEVIVKAKWKANTYKISLKTDHGKLDSKFIKVKYNTKVEKLPILESTKKLKFVGWYTGSDGKGRRVNNDTILTTTNNITLYAYWSRI